MLQDWRISKFNVNELSHMWTFFLQQESKRSLLRHLGSWQSRNMETCDHMRRKQTTPGPASNFKISANLTYLIPYTNSLKWVLWCTLRVPFRVKRFPQVSHLNGLFAGLSSERILFLILYLISFFSFVSSIYLQDVFFCALLSNVFSWILCHTLRICILSSMSVSHWICYPSFWARYSFYFVHLHR